MKFLIRVVLPMLCLGGLGFYGFVVWPLRDPHPPVLPKRGAIAVTTATVYVSPQSAPLENATLVARDGRIEAVGPAVSVPADADVLPCNNCVVTAGFWNLHVHFTEPKWSWAAWKRSGELNTQLADMLTSRGFTTVVDLGSDPRETISLRRRIEKGNLLGPKIYTAGRALYPENGIPFYVRENAPAWMLKLMLQPATVSEAVTDESRNIESGADVLKLFTGAYIEPGTVKPMSREIARAAVELAHSRGQVAFAHPSNPEGVNVALEGGVDVLAHAPDTTEGFDDAEIDQMAARASMVPTLKMFATTVTNKPAYLDPIHAIVRRFHEKNGNLLFGTDVGYMTDYSTGDEFQALERCGLTPTEILAMLTTGPARRMGAESEKGTLEPGKLADFVVLGSDPAQSVEAFSDVQATVRSGRILWHKAR